MLYFTYDYEEYVKKRGLYFDIRKYLNGGSNEDEVIHVIKNMDSIEERSRSIRFRNHFVNFYGNATIEAVDFIAKELGE